MDFLAALGAAALVLLGLCLFVVLAFCGLLVLFLVAEAVLNRTAGGRRDDD